ncbi:hypothetical protein [Frankia sp. AgB32]|uniref:hypothetical protein n=1 Tax=Frankia sp. AgB32 TaxID=631119 RepID=UPI00200CC19A|nr:hypothetical protein [Frankia sp. AgB32]MCK9893113.1 hypothetical protein [Frankia sp. AgB32]
MLDRILSLCEDGHTLYRTVPPVVKRQLNQAAFQRFWIMDKGIHGSDVYPPLAQILTNDLAERLTRETEILIKAQNVSDASEQADPETPYQAGMPDSL